MTAPVLELCGLSKLFGGLVAVDGVSLSVNKGETHAVIGPNGAGKSTLVNLITGHLAPSDGLILLNGRDVTGASAPRMARHGVGRGYQKTNVFPSLSVFENVRLAAQARLPTSMRFFRPAAGLRRINEQAEQAMELCGIAGCRMRAAGEMSHGEQRQLELAMVLATGPDLLVLDEPLAGMGHEESDAMVALLQKLAKDFTLILVEHDMDAVFSVAGMLTVMVNGAVLESGPAETVRASARVREAYLGDGAEVC